MKIAAIVMGLALAGCASSADAWRGDDRFTLAQRASIEAAAHWMTVHADAPPVDIVWGPAAVMCEHAIIVADLPAGEIGDSGGGCIRIDSDKGADRVGEIVAHEMQHERGYHHHPGVGLMNADVPPTMMWTDADRAAR